MIYDVAEPNPDERTNPASIKMDEVEITPAMIDAGTERFLELLQAGVDSTYLVKQVFLSMFSYLDHE